MDPFTAIMVAIGAGFLVGLLLLGLLHPRTGAQALDWRPTRSAELEVQNEIDDLDQMLEATNARRRRRGEPELTETSLRASIGADVAQTAKRRDDYLEDLDIAQMLNAKNARRRAKGLPEITAEEYRAQIAGERR
ncbi:MAG TPA: hypothetical protein VK501_16110 [Baekduia sp.]|uniref:hypothetical protein n=1 Tax=Baekduia sp. TaxID=2600305 RepID=UPI002C7CB965|nr:hypothetical protein [Baekduia sp.]HMJ35433.1 hypothetical protein [Baekduia sp.]